MRNPFLFFVDLAKQPLWVSMWVAILALANLASLLFWAAPIAKIIFIVFLLSATAMMIFYSCFGFEKILGIAHIFWVFLVPFMLLELAYYDGIFFLYLVTLSILLSVSLVFDAIDVWKYFRETRK
jgi:hypothetical protein